MLKFLNNQFTKTYFPIYLKYISLVGYIILIVIGLLAYSNDAKFLHQLRNTNLGNLIVWSFWWPLIIILAIFFGRIWCMVCPVELITTFFSKIGLKKKRPQWLLSGWVITIFYVIILFIGIHGVAIHRNPTFMSAYLLIIVVVSIIIGGIYEKNTFCRYVCPVGYLLGLYSRLSFIGFRVKSNDVCNSCSDKSCIQKRYQYQLNYKSCGVDLYPAKIDDNSDCILCAGCVKTCNSYQSEPNSNRPNLGITKIGFASDLMKLKTLKMAEFVFILIVSGFVIYEIWAEWSISKSQLMYFPNLINNQLPIDNSLLKGLIKSSVIFVILPVIIWYIPFLVARIAGVSLKLKDYMLNYSIAFIPIIASAHLIKSILKTTSRLPYFEYLFDDITGISTAQKIIDKEIVLFKYNSVTTILISLSITAIVIGGIWLSMKIIKMLNTKYELNSSSKIYYLIPAIYGGIFLGMIIMWRWVSN